MQTSYSVRGNPPMKAAVAVVGRYYNQQGGVSNVMAQLAMKASKHYDVTVAAGEFLDWDENLNGIQIPMPPRPNWVQVPSFAVASRFRVKKFAPGLIHAHDPQYIGADLYTAHSCFKSYIRRERSSAGSIKGLLSRVYPPHISASVMSRLAYGSAPMVVAVSGSIRTEIIEEHKLPAERVRVIYNGVDLNRFSAEGRHSARMRLESELALNLQSKLLLIFVGYEFDRKRLDVVLRAMAELEPEQSHLLVVGGADANKYLQLARDLGIASQVSFMGHRADVAALLKASDVFVFPTKYEAASLAILEAAAAGLAVVTTDVAMAGEVFRDGDNALLVPNVNSHHAVAARLKQLAADRHLLSSLGNRAAILAKSFSWESIWGQYDALYEEILECKEGRS